MPDAAATPSEPSRDRTSDDLDAAREVLRCEADGVLALAAALDARFTQATDILSGITGRLVVTGMGKSGQIARKIAATFASTGTPAIFVHPSEASHGDLGMITPEDAVLALSNSGETQELTDLVAYTRRFAIPLIAIVGREKTSLSEAADVALILPTVPEAGPIGLAPTTSTTMMLALGDALAICVLRRKGFSTDDFHLLHPGGKLGHMLTRVDELMHAGDEIPLVPSDLAMTDALIVMTGKHFGCLGVIDEGGRLMGVVTDGDLRRHMNDGLLGRTTGEIMTADPKAVGEHMLAAEALRLMNEQNITALFVVDEVRRPVGILHIHDCLRTGVA